MQGKGQRSSSQAMINIDINLAELGIQRAIKVVGIERKGTKWRGREGFGVDIDMSLWYTRHEDII